MELRRPARAESVVDRERGEQQGGDRRRVERRPIGDRPFPPEHRADNAQSENKLPRQRIEKPGPQFRPVRQGPAKHARGEIKRERDAEREVGADARQGEDRWRQEQQHHIHRQNVEITDLLSEHQDAERALQGLVKQKRSAVLFQQTRRSANRIGGPEDGDGKSGQADMHAVDAERARAATLDQIAPIGALGSPIMGERDRELPERKTKASALSERAKLRGVAFSRRLPGM